MDRVGGDPEQEAFSHRTGHCWCDMAAQPGGYFGAFTFSVRLLTTLHLLCVCVEDGVLLSRMKRSIYLRTSIDQFGDSNSNCGVTTG